MIEAILSLESMRLFKYTLFYAETTFIITYRINCKRYFDIKKTSLVFSKKS